MKTSNIFHLQEINFTSEYIFHVTLHFDLDINIQFLHRKGALVINSIGLLVVSRTACVACRKLLICRVCVCLCVCEVPTLEINSPSPLPQPPNPTS